MSRLRTRQVSGFILVSALALALTLPAAAQPFDRLDLGSLWHTFQSWLRPEGPPPPPSGTLVAETLFAGVDRDPNGATVAVEVTPDPQAPGASTAESDSH